MLINIITILQIGFSVIGAAILLIVYLFFLNNINKNWFAVSSCIGLLSCLSTLQIWHLDFILNQTDLFNEEWYRFFLFLAPCLFFFFSRAVLLPEKTQNLWLLLHLAPVSLNYFIRQEIAIPIIFTIGLGYSCWLANLIYHLRAERKKFKVEMFFFGLFSIIAAFVLILGFSTPHINHYYFYIFYANSIGLSFVLIVSAFVTFPDLLGDLIEASKLTYSQSKLKDVNIQSSLAMLEEQMTKAKLYKNESLSLSITADVVGLTPHQLSELVNRHFGMNFSRYIRDQRVNAAKVALINEPKASVLSIGLDVGFGTQSNFYAAFKEITGMSPGAFRKSMSQKNEGFIKPTKQP
jgi:AraC-like DNA-binding protein